MDKFKVSIIDYLGKLETGVLVLISIVYQDQYYEATFFYTQDQMLLTTSEDLEANLGHPINQDAEYDELVSEILKRVIPHSEIYNRIDEVDFSKWTKLVEELPEDQSEVEYLPDQKQEDQD